MYLRTHVLFRSDKFFPYTGEEQTLNPNLWGRRLVEYLKPKLAEQGLLTKDFYSKDWGWVLPILHAPVPMWLSCGHYGQDPDRYLVFINPMVPVANKLWLFKRVDISADIQQLADTLDEILNSDPEIWQIQWLSLPELQERIAQEK